MSSRGFTKIEILIVAILIVLVLAADFFVISYLNSKQQDVQVMSEISRLRSGLEAYLLKNNYYPVSLEPLVLNSELNSSEKLCVEGFEKFSFQCAQEILNPVPNLYLTKGNSYIYKSTDNNKNYQLEFTLLSDFPAQNLKKGKNCATNSQIISQPCF
ncbi:MAG: type II secretion system protein [Patescibacteria group bacterium]